MEDAAQNRSLVQGLRHTNRRLFISTAAWVITTAIATFGPESLWAYKPLETQAAILINVMAGVFMLFSFYKHLMSMDELQRQTHLEAMAMSLGVTMIFTIAYSSLAAANLLTNAHPSNVLFVMGVTYIATVIVLWIRRTAG